MSKLDESFGDEGPGAEPSCCVAIAAMMVVCEEYERMQRSADLAMVRKNSASQPLLAHFFVRLTRVERPRLTSAMVATKRGSLTPVQRWRSNNTTAHKLQCNGITNINANQKKRALWHAAGDQAVPRTILSLSFLTSLARDEKSSA